MSPAAKGKTRPCGEIGVLSEIRHYSSRPGRVYLVIEHEGEPYIGCLLIDDASFSDKLVKRLRYACGMAIHSVGSLDIPLPAP
jgi:hypothetical protein